jgi:jumonji domain-containing protein 7
VAQSRPCVITGVVAGWPAAARWSDDGYLRAAMAGAPPVAVNVTPHGRGDAVHARAEHGGQDVFVLPCEERMPFGAFLEALDASADADAGDAAGVPYVSAQDGSLRRDFAALAADVPADLPWATDAFGAPPDAVNLWIGNGRSVTSFHADHYENMYAVLRGAKVFTLVPPADLHRLHAAPAAVGRFARAPGAPGGWSVALAAPPRRVRWARVDPDGDAAHRAAHPRYFGPHAPPALRVTLHAGELLYLPALWQHHVAQEGRRVIAVNWWHDMAFDHRYAHAQLLRGLARALAAARGDAAGDATDEEAAEAEAADAQ